VKLADENIQDELKTDTWIMNTRDDYRSVWVFLDKGSGDALRMELENRGIEYILIVE